MCEYTLDLHWIDCASFQAGVHFDSSRWATFVRQSVSMLHSLRKTTIGYFCLCERCGVLVFADLSNLFAIVSRAVHMFLILFVLLLCWRCCQGVHLHRAVVSLPFRRFAFTSRRRRIAVHDTVRAALATRAAAAPPTVHGEVGAGGRVGHSVWRATCVHECWWSWI